MPRSLISRLFIAGVVASVAVAGLYLFVVARSGISLLDVRSALAIVRNANVWIVDPDGNIHFQTHAEPLPKEWSHIPRRELGMAAFMLMENRTDRLASLPLLGRPERIVVFKVPPLISLAFSMETLPIVLVFLGHALIIAALTCSLLLVGMIAYHRRYSRMATQVLERLKRGDLQARFPISRLDEVGHLMLQFNAMADQIEKLFVELREAETARSQLLRELGHDIRTPLTAVRGIVEMVGDCADRMSAGDIRSQMELASVEVRYFQRLIDDLFLLAQCEERSFDPEEALVDLGAQLKTEADLLQSTAKRQGKDIRFGVTVPDEAVLVLADPYLLRRVLRNGLENAVQYCRTEVNALLQTHPDGLLELTLRDDGPGLSPEAIATFGIRRSGRFMDHTANKKISLGLGSVILSKIISKYQGEMAVTNWQTANGQIGGAELRIRLRLAAGGRARAA